MIPLTLVIPVYNEHKALRALGARLHSTLATLGPEGGIILVDDGSIQRTAQALQEIAGRSPNIQLLRHDRNRGYGAALKTGIHQAGTDWIAICDADGTYPLQALPDLVRQIEDGADMSVASRRLAHQPLLRRPAKILLNALASYLVDTPIPDLNSGLRIFRKADALRFEKILPSGFSFTTTLTMGLLSEGFDVGYVPVSYRPRVGESKIRPVRDTIAFLSLICRISLMFNPLRIFGPVSALMIFAGLALLLARLLTEEPFGVVTTVVLIVGGLHMLAIGLLADLINRRT